MFSDVGISGLDNHTTKPQEIRGHRNRIMFKMPWTKEKSNEIFLR